MIDKYYNQYMKCDCCDCCDCCDDNDDDMSSLFSLCSESCSGCCNCDCDDNCASIPIKKDNRLNSEKIRDDGCFCRGRCGEFQPMVEPDGSDGKCLCYGCKNGY